jgi:uncharacterized protein (DUF433 family)
MGSLIAISTNTEQVVCYPELTEDDIHAALAYAANHERRTLTAAE